VGNLLYGLVLEYGHFPDQPEGLRRAELRAAVADLRHLEGYLVTAGGDPPDDAYEAALCRTAVRMAREVGKIADTLEKTLGTWRGEEVS
jgi:hypothetical protein